ncbi:MAG: 2-isopropylmalate synthase [Proteobacteria bacterium]|nr:2-isopropylmalate synthase [Pseudomonadota bacterium]
MSERIAIFDTTLRDGEQSAGVCFSTEDKVSIARQLAGMGVDVIEAGFPAASAAESEAVAAVCAAVEGARVCALARAVSSDVGAARRALAGARDPRIHVFINASDVQLAHQLRASRDQVLAIVDACVREAREGADDVEFSPMDATRADVDFLEQVVRVALAAGATTINLPDTVGCATPEQVSKLFRDVRQRVPEVRDAVLSFHGQDDLGLATANALAAVAAGARQVEVAVNGIGERAGNTSFEEVVMALRVHGGAWGVATGVDPAGIYAVSRLVEERSGLPVPPNKAIVGRNAFRHASGIHQDGVIKWRENYELLDPATIGHPTGTEIVLGKLSGRAGFAARAGALGFELADEVLDRAFRRFQEVADSAREVRDERVREICQEALTAAA